MPLLPTCPPEPDESAEAYVMQKLSAEKAGRFRNHIGGCERCRQCVAFYEAYVEDMRAAAISVEEDGIRHAPQQEAAGN
jgi:anti-sigma factor RsiW